MDRAVQLPHLKVAISPQSLIIEGDPEQAFYEDTQRTFGSDRITIIYLSDPALFTPEKLEAIAKMGYEGVKAIIRHRAGQAVPKEVDTGVELVTRDRLSDPKIRELLDSQI